MVLSGSAGASPYQSLPYQVLVDDKVVKTIHDIGFDATPCLR